MMSRQDWCQILTGLNTLANATIAEQRALIAALVKERGRDRAFIQQVTSRLEAIVAAP